MPAPADRIIFESPLVRIGAFRCEPGRPDFADSGPAHNFCFVFPRTSVTIEHEHDRPFAANPAVVTFYNAGQLYRRGAISPEGDRCDWFGVEEEAAREAVRAFDPGAADHPERPFRLTRGSGEPRTYWMQRRLFTAAAGGGGSDPLFVEEQTFTLLNLVLRAAYQRSGAVAVSWREAVHEAEVLLSQPWQPAPRLADLAAGTGVSPFHLCRMFRRATGLSLYQYRRRVRLNESLEAVTESSRPLIDIALDAGFSSHSHFTAAFRHQFGRAPSALRHRA